MAFELEIPAVYIDAVLLDPTPTTPVVINRDPEPGEVQVPIDAAIAMSLPQSGGHQKEGLSGVDHGRSRRQESKAEAAAIYA
jgi:hypothetical protein